MTPSSPWITRREVAAVVRMPVSGAGAFVTGQMPQVDGGAQT
jgi:hypothetical protein